MKLAAALAVLAAAIAVTDGGDTPTLNETPLTSQLAAPEPTIVTLSTSAPVTTIRTADHTPVTHLSTFRTAHLDAGSHRV